MPGAGIEIKLSSPARYSCRMVRVAAVSSKWIASRPRSGASSANPQPCRTFS